MYKNREKFDAVLPEVMDCLLSSSKFTQYNLPEVGNWVKKLVNHTIHGGKQGRALAVPFAYQTMEDPKYFTEEKLHSAQFLGWSLEMLHGFIITVDDIIDASTTRRGKPCWHLLPNVGTSAVNDCVLLFHCVMELLDIKFGKEPFYTDLVKLINESIMYTSIGQYLDHTSGYTKEKNNLDGFTMERFDAIAIQKTAWYSFRLPMLAGLLLVKNGKEKDTTELSNICWEFGKILQFQLRTLHRSSVAFGVPVAFNMYKNREKFDAVLPEVMDCIMSSSKFTQYNLPEVGSWVKKLLTTTMDGGKKGRGLAVPFAYQKMEDPQYFTEEKLHAARFLGWGLEMMQAYILTVDDIMDASTTRRGKTCWYLQPNVGISAINDCILIYQSFMELLDIRFGKEPFYTDLIKLINESIMYTSIGQYLDHISGYTKEKNNLDGFTMERFDAIAIQKTGWYSFRLPMLAGLLLTKNGKEKDTTELTSICWEFGKILQFQNDYKDIYWSEDASGKAGTDIQEGKLSWISVAALERCNETQREVFKENYGSKEPEHVERIKQLYDELQIEEVYKKYSNSVYENLERRIRALPNKGETEFCLEVMEACRRQIY